MWACCVLWTNETHRLGSTLPVCPTQWFNIQANRKKQQHANKSTKGNKFRKWWWYKHDPTNILVRNNPCNCWWWFVTGALTSFLISHSRFRMQSSFLLRQRCAAMRFLLRRLTSWMNSSCSDVSLCILTNIWKSFRGRFVIWSIGKGSFT